MTTNLLQNDIRSLLSDWCHGLSRHQIDQPDDIERHGGLVCPDCGIVHGRCGDALYPFLRMARQTGDDPYGPRSRNGKNRDLP